MILKDVFTTRISKEYYNKLTPFEQGYVTYIRAEWPDNQIPKNNPYTKSTSDWEEFNNGNQMAMQHVVDMEE